MLFIGEQRSRKAVEMGVHWKDGRLAAKQLFDALRDCGIDPTVHTYHNVFERGGAALFAIRAAVKRGEPVIGMGRKVQGLLEGCGIPHIPLVHPAARGAIREKATYAAHVRDTLQAAGLLLPVASSCEEG